MLIGLFHRGSGVGNQLFRYIMTRVIAEEKGFDFGMAGEFKGDSFMKINKGKFVPFNTHTIEPEGRLVVESDYDFFMEDASDYDWSIKDIKDNTIIDGEFQGEEYFEHRLKDIKNWLWTEKLEMPDDVCVLAFRGGEFVGLKDLFLPKEYWDLAISKIKDINPNMKFEVHTDDEVTAKQFFPDYKVIHNVGINWRSIRYAKYIVLSNSSFGIIPALLNEKAKKIYAPKYWLRRNIGVQFMKYNEYKKFEAI